MEVKAPTCVAVAVAKSQQRSQRYVAAVAVA